MSQTYVIKLGGSAFSTKESLVDLTYLLKFREVLVENIRQGNKFFIAPGGGYTSRMYRDKLIEAGVDDKYSQHSVGLMMNTLHATFIRGLFYEYADQEVPTKNEYLAPESFHISKSVQLGGGSRPGHSGDFDALQAAIHLKATTVFSLKNIDGVYSSDPKKDPSAVFLDKIGWDEYLEIIGNPGEHAPGANYPIDPHAARLAKEHGVRFVILGSTDLENFNKALKGEPFHGTIVES